MKAHVGADAQQHESWENAFTSRSPDSRYLLWSWLCVFQCPSGCLNEEETTDSHQESHPDFSVFLPTAYTQPKNDLRYEVMDKTNNGSTPDRDNRFLYSQSV
jgi:hypothetical protein